MKRGSRKDVEYNSEETPYDAASAESAKSAKYTVSEWIDVVTNLLWIVRLCLIGIVVGIVLRNSIDFSQVVSPMMNRLDEMVFDKMPGSFPTIDFSSGMTEDMSLPIVTDPVSFIHMLCFLLAVITLNIVVTKMFELRLRKILTQRDVKLGERKTRRDTEDKSTDIISEEVISPRISILELLGIKQQHQSLKDYLQFFHSQKHMQAGFILGGIISGVVCLTVIFPGGSIIDFLATVSSAQPGEVVLWFNSGPNALTSIFLVVNVVVTFLLVVVVVYATIVTTYGFSIYIWYENYREKRNISAVWELSAINLLTIFLITGVRGVVSHETVLMREFSPGPLPTLWGPPINYSIFLSVLSFISLYVIVFTFSVKEYKNINQ